ncbi:MAG: alpha/beta fold hydrolase [Achromobacter sp.]|nr:alpha/beta fold hydrolase [Achromobacter sp.]
MSRLRLFPCSTYALAFAVLLLASAAHGASGDPAPRAVDVGAGGASRSILLAGETAGDHARPLILALHGGGSNARAFAAETGLAAAAAERGFVVAFLEGSGTTPGARTFNSGACCGHAQANQIDDVDYARRVVATLAAQGLADPARVYAVGFSNGGMMAYRLAAQAPELVAGVAVVSGTLDIDPALARVAKPVLHIHGTVDPYVPYAGGVGAKATTAKPRLAVEAALETWARLGCGGASRPVARRTESLPDAAGDGTRVERREYGCAGAPPAVLYVIDGGGHAWPSGRGPANPESGTRSRNLDATAAAVSFFSALAAPASGDSR